jgi:hypothetical protein
MKIASIICLAVCLSSPVFAQQPTTAEVNEATKKLRAEEAARTKIELEKALVMTRANAEKTAAAPPSTARVRQPVNIKIEFTLSDQRATGAPTKRLVTAVVSDGGFGQIRSSSDVAGIGGGVTLNVDINNPEILADGKIRLGFSLVYDWPAPVEAPRENTRGTLIKTAMHDSMSLILENGKPMVALQSADPMVDRQVTVEIKATVLR